MSRIDRREQWECNQVLYPEVLQFDLTHIRSKCGEANIRVQLRITHLPQTSLRGLATNPDGPDVEHSPIHSRKDPSSEQP
jgi:hypothetical protein